MEGRRVVVEKGREEGEGEMGRTAVITNRADLRPV